MKKDTIEKKLQRLYPELKRDYHVKQLGYFGSYARNEQTAESDIDILIDFSQSPGWNFFDVQKKIENTLGVPVDLVTTRALKPLIRDSILQEIIYVS